MNYVKVQNSDGLVRDMSSNAIINMNDKEYTSYMCRRSQAEERKRQINKQAEEIESIKTEMLEIKSLLLEMIKGK